MSANHRVMGSASKIIKDAMALGILCRPCHDYGTHLLGSGLEVSAMGFRLWEPNGEPCHYHPTPSEMTMAWELVTKDIVRNEYLRLSSDPW